MNPLWLCNISGTACMYGITPLFSRSHHGGHPLQLHVGPCRARSTLVKLRVEENRKKTTYPAGGQGGCHLLRRCFYSPELGPVQNCITGVCRLKAFIRRLCARLCGQETNKHLPVGRLQATSFSVALFFLFCTDSSSDVYLGRTIKN